ncbi:M23 family metallopeptidase [Microbacterium sp. GXF7504]
MDAEPREPDEAATPTPARRGLRQATRSKTRPARTPRGPRTFDAKKPLRSVVVLAMVGGLVATVALPAYAAWNPEGDVPTIEQVAADNAQSLVVASDVVTTDLSRSSYAATTAEEVATKKAAEAAAARAAQIARSSGGGGAVLSSVDLSLVAPGSGQVRWPLDMSAIKIGRGISGSHDGVDLLGAANTPEFAAAAGTVRVASWFGGYGNGVVIDHVINGVTVSTLYGHMNQILVSPGQTVSAGQIIGLMGSTGRSTANHLHFEVRVNGGLVDPMAWLYSNAG